MNPIVKYLQDTRAELRHVAWPTREQTIIYTVMVALISIGVALYLGLFDYIFTGALTRVINVLPAAPAAQTQQIPVDNTQQAPAATNPTPTTNTNTTNGPTFTIPGASGQAPAPTQNTTQPAPAPKK